MSDDSLFFYPPDDSSSASGELPPPAGDSAAEAELDREVCLCFHVSLRKLVGHLRLNPTPVASQLSECYGAGTGCGWCIPHLEHLHEQFHRGEAPRLSMTPEEYAQRRKAWKQSKRRDWTSPDAITSPMTSPPDIPSAPNASALISPQSCDSIPLAPASDPPAEFSK